MKSIEPVQLQRLVDGELGWRETQDVLRFAEQHPEQWRQIASAFVEDQVWRSEFSERCLLLGEAGDEKHQQPSVAADEFDVPGGVWWVSLAATVVLALSIGFLVGQNESPTSELAGASGPRVGAESPDGMAIAQQDHVVDDLNQKPAVYHMQLQDPAGNEMMDSEIPLYPVSKRNEFNKWLKRDEIPSAVRLRARNSGYQVKQDIRYLSGRLSDGREFVIPVRNYRFVPHQ